MMMMMMLMMTVNRLLRLKLPGSDPPGDMRRREAAHCLHIKISEYLGHHHHNHHHHHHHQGHDHDHRTITWQVTTRDFPSET